jgi:hypothetical protein
MPEFHAHGVPCHGRHATVQPMMRGECVFFVSVEMTRVACSHTNTQSVPSPPLSLRPLSMGMVDSVSPRTMLQRLSVDRRISNVLALDGTMAAGNVAREKSTALQSWQTLYLLLADCLPNLLLPRGRS